MEIKRNICRALVSSGMYMVGLHALPVLLGSQHKLKLPKLSNTNLIHPKVISIASSIAPRTAQVKKTYFGE